MSGDAVNGTPGAAPLDLPAFDPGNPLVQQAPPLPTLLTADVVQGPRGKVLLLTIRTPDTTLTLKLPREDVEVWAGFLRDRVADLSGIVLPPSGRLIL